MNELLPQRDVYTVSRLNTEVKMVLEGSFPLLWVEGEISNFSRPSSGHLYFTLKDAHAGVSCALFRNRGRLLNFNPANGQQVLIRARVTLYDVRGSYQLSVEHMEPAGDGALRRRFEELKSRLERDGLFAAEAKRPLPPLPRRIGLITSPSGAAVQDVLTVLGRRFPAVPVRIYPVPVQGHDAAPRIAAAIARANRRRDCDLLILTRGGGSLEDLWAFNEEVVARAIAAGTIPLISAVGHEIDVTIADFVADRRAPTPSAAAEMAVPDRRDLHIQVTQLGRRLAGRVGQELSAAGLRMQHVEARMARVHPRLRLRTAAQRLDELELRLRRRFQYELARHATSLAHARTRLAQTHPRRRLSLVGQRVTALGGRLRRALTALQRAQAAALTHHRQRLLAQSPARLVSNGHERLQQLERRLLPAQRRHLHALSEHLTTQARALHAISPLATLERGYAIAQRRDDESVVRRSDDVAVGDAIRVRLHDGRLDCAVTAVTQDRTDDP